MNSTILVTGAGTGIRSRTVRALAEVQTGESERDQLWWWPQRDSNPRLGLERASP